MLHSPNSFLIHDISVGTTGASKQPLSKPKQPRERGEGPAAQSRTSAPRSPGTGHLETTFQSEPAVPYGRVPSLPHPPFGPWSLNWTPGLFVIKTWLVSKWFRLGFFSVTLHENDQICTCRKIKGFPKYFYTHKINIFMCTYI